MLAKRNVDAGPSDFHDWTPTSEWEFHYDHNLSAPWIPILYTPRDTTPTEGILFPSSATCLNLYPNPATGKVSVSLAGGNRDGATGGMLEVIDLKGRVVLRHPLPQGSAPFTLDLETLSPGLYLVRAGNLTRKLAIR